MLVVKPHEPISAKRVVVCKVRRGTPRADPGDACEMGAKIESVESAKNRVESAFIVTQGNAMSPKKTLHAFWPEVGGIS